jgi:hypothetical protein
MRKNSRKFSSYIYIHKYIYRVCIFVIIFLRSSYIFGGFGNKSYSVQKNKTGEKIGDKLFIIFR